MSALPFLFSISILVLVSAASSFQDSTDWQTCNDAQDGVSFRYPAHWKHAPEYADRTEFEGPEGSVQIAAADGDSPQAVCRANARHKLRPYGEHPHIEILRVQGQPACIIWPSADQGAPYYAELVVAYPHPVTIDGNEYKQLLVNAHKNYMRAIVATLKFIPATNKRPLPQNRSGMLWNAMRVGAAL